MKITIEIVGEAVTVEIESDNETKVVTDTISTIDENPTSALDKFVDDAGFIYKYVEGDVVKRQSINVGEQTGLFDMSVDAEFVIKHVISRNKRQLLTCSCSSKKIKEPIDLIVDEDYVISVASELDLLEIM